MQAHACLRVLGLGKAIRAHMAFKKALKNY
jgi:hypothetical protein